VARTCRTSRPAVAASASAGATPVNGGRTSPSAEDLDEAEWADTTHGDRVDPAHHEFELLTPSQQRQPAEVEVEHRRQHRGGPVDDRHRAYESVTTVP
jgi:hypothetical protein